MDRRPRAPQTNKGRPASTGSGLWAERAQAGPRHAKGPSRPQALGAAAVVKGRRHAVRYLWGGPAWRGPTPAAPEAPRPPPPRSPRHRSSGDLERPGSVRGRPGGAREHFRPAGGRAATSRSEGEWAPGGGGGGGCGGPLAQPALARCPRSRRDLGLGRAWGARMAGRRGHTGP